MVEFAARSVEARPRPKRKGGHTDIAISNRTSIRGHVIPRVVKYDLDDRQALIDLGIVMPQDDYDENGLYRQRSFVRRSQW
jgi:hypothetical protein